MKFICCSDWHLLWDNPSSRLDNLAEVQFDKLKFILEQAQHHKTNILQAGDFFDKPRSWSLLPVVIELLKQYDINIYSIFGQHDTYLYSEATRERTSLGILEKAGLVHILTDQPISIQNIDLYGASWGSHLVRTGSTIPGRVSIGVVHESISDVPLYPDHKFAQSNKFLQDNPDYDFILCGDIHRKFESHYKGRTLINTGPMIRKEATEYNFEHKPSCYLLDTEGKSYWIEIPHSKGSAVLSRDHIERQKEAENLLDEFVSEIKNKAEEGANVSFSDNLRIFINENNIRKEVVNILSEITEKKKREEEL